MLTTEDINRIADAVHAKHAESDFHIKPKEHYDQHQRLDRMLTLFDQCQSMALKGVVCIILLIGVVTSIIWAAIHK